MYYYKVKQPTKINLLLAIIRSLVFFLIGLLLINPSIPEEVLFSQKTKLSVLVDNSSSIKYFKKDSLINHILEGLKNDKKLNKKFNIDYYSFGNKFQLSDTFNFNDNQTDISIPLKKITRIQKNRNSPIVLISDGNQTIGNDYLYTKIKEPVFELSTLLENEEDFNVNAPDEWNVELLTVGDTITPDMWGYNGIFFDVSKPLTIEDIGEDEGGWWIQLGRSEAPFDLDEINEYLKSKYRVIPYILEESDDDDFNVSASPEWNVTELGVGDIITPDMWDYTKDGDEFRNKIAKSFIINRIFKEDGWDSGWGVSIVHYIPEFPQTSTLGGLEYGLGELNNHLKPQYKIFIPGALNESDDDFNVSAPESWWEYDGDIEIMFQDTYWYEDENGKEAIVERDGGGILNINDLKQYSYSGWIPFTGDPTIENLNKWYSSIDWDIDLIEIFSFDDSIFEVEEDFDWSSAENVDMDRTGFEIRAVSTLKEVEDEFTVKAPKKWDIVYLNKGDKINVKNLYIQPNNFIVGICFRIS